MPSASCFLVYVSLPYLPSVQQSSGRRRTGMRRSVGERVVGPMRFNPAVWNNNILWDKEERDRWPLENVGTSIERPGVPLMLDSSFDCPSIFRHDPGRRLEKSVKGFNIILKRIF